MPPSLRTTVRRVCVTVSGGRGIFRRRSVIVVVSRSAAVQRGKCLAVGLLTSWVSSRARFSLDRYSRAGCVLSLTTWRRQRVAACSTKLLEDFSLRTRAQAKRLGQFQPSVPLFTSRITRCREAGSFSAVEVVHLLLAGLGRVL